MEQPTLGGAMLGHEHVTRWKLHLAIMHDIRMPFEAADAEGERRHAQLGEHDHPNPPGFYVRYRKV
jgi:hypothetical protein